MGGGRESEGRDGRDVIILIHLYPCIYTEIFSLYWDSPPVLVPCPIPLPQEFLQKSMWKMHILSSFPFVSNGN